LNSLFADQTTNKTRPIKPKLILIISLVLTYIVAAPGIANAQAKKPNIHVIFGDDIGHTIHDFDVSNRVEGEGCNFTASLKF
jgi:hypothetical protein